MHHSRDEAAEAACEHQQPITSLETTFEDVSLPSCVRRLFECRAADIKQMSSEEFAAALKEAHYAGRVEPTPASIHEALAFISDFLRTPEPLLVAGRAMEALEKLERHVEGLERLLRMQR